MYAQPWEDGAYETRLEGYFRPEWCVEHRRTKGHKRETLVPIGTIFFYRGRIQDGRCATNASKHLYLLSTYCTVEVSDNL